MFHSDCLCESLQIAEAMLCALCPHLWMIKGSLASLPSCIQASLTFIGVAQKWLLDWTCRPKEA